MNERPVVNGIVIGSAETALTDGGYLTDQIYDADGNDVFDQVWKDVFCSQDAPTKSLDTAAAILTNSYCPMGGLAPTATVFPEDPNGDVLLWHVGPDGAVPIIRDSGAGISGIKLGELIPAA
jgi:hypothetical protein